MHISVSGGACLITSQSKEPLGQAFRKYNLSNFIHTIENETRFIPSGSVSQRRRRPLRAWKARPFSTRRHLTFSKRENAKVLLWAEEEYDKPFYASINSCKLRVCTIWSREKVQYYYNQIKSNIYVYITRKRIRMRFNIPVFLAVPPVAMYGFIHW